MGRRAEKLLQCEWQIVDKPQIAVAKMYNKKDKTLHYIHARKRSPPCTMIQSVPRFYRLFDRQKKKQIAHPTAMHER